MSSLLRCPICLLLLPGLDELNQHLDLSHPVQDPSPSPPPLSIAAQPASHTRTSSANTVDPSRKHSRVIRSASRRRSPSPALIASSTTAGSGKSSPRRAAPPPVMITSAVEEGQNRSRTSLYRELRRPAVDRYRLERNRLLGRMDRLRLLYITGDNIPPAGTLIHPLFVNILKHPTATRASDAPFRESEMEIGHWQPDADANQCPICYRQFSFLSAVLSTPASLFSGYSAQATAERKHHCRLCGKVICGRPSCSYYIQLSAASDDYETGDQYDCTAKQLRACANCYRLIGGSEKKCFDAFTNELIELYKSITDAKCLVSEKLLPEFNDILTELEPHDATSIKNSPELLGWYKNAAEIRKRLLILFEDLERSGKRCTQLHCRHASDRKLHNAIYQSIQTFLHGKMFTLQMLPRLDGNAVGNPRLSRSSTSASLLPESESDITQNGQPSTAISSDANLSIKHSLSTGTLQKFTSLFSTARKISADTPALDLENILAIPQQIPRVEDLPDADRQAFTALSEQKAQLENFITNAACSRRFNDVRVLQGNLEEINREMERLLRRQMN